MTAGQSWSTRFCCRIELTSTLWSKYAIYVIVGIPKEHSLVYFLMPIVSMRSNDVFTLVVPGIGYIFGKTKDFCKALSSLIY
jgi:hypothetical protein